MCECARASQNQARIWESENMPIGPEISDALPKHVGYGLPCANCRAYYTADLSVCPVCGSSERVPANAGDVRRKCRTTFSATTRVPAGLQQKVLLEAWAASGKEAERRR